MAPALLTDVPLQVSAIRSPTSAKLASVCSPTSAKLASATFSAFAFPMTQEPPRSPSPPALLEPSLSFGAVLPTPFVAVHHAFRYHAITQPDAIAAEQHGESITYGELDLASQHLAARLRAIGVKPGVSVCLLVKRSIGMIVGILAVLKAGGTYVPLDGGVATDGILSHVLSDALPLVVLASAPFVARPSQHGHRTTICLEDAIEEAKLKTTRPRVVDMTEPEDVAYIIYTSGTTGKPKGVMVTHSNVTNLLCQKPGNIGMRPGLRVAQLLNVAFDMCAWEVLGGLMNGCTIVLRGSKAEDWRRCLASVDVVISTPSILAAYDPAQYPNIRIVATAGEPCSVTLADRWARAGAAFHNCCGPTETTIVNTVHRHVLGAPLTIGRPTPNNNVYVLDEELRPVPVGEVGVMWAGGQGISAGYANLPELTASRYLHDPFSRDGGVMFNTGDLGCMLTDGSFEHFGRVDDQVKVKGFRVELDGVTAVLSSAPGVNMAVALLVEQELVAFVEPQDVCLDTVRVACGKLLPYYAVPTKVCALPQLPMTANGKVDKRLLRQMAANHIYSRSS